MTGRRRQQERKPIPPSLWAVTGIILGLALRLTLRLPALPLALLGLLVAANSARPPQPRSGRKNDPIDPRDQKHWQTWLDIRAGLTPGRHWLKPSRAAWYPPVGLTLLLDTGMNAGPALLDAACAWTLAITLLRHADRHADHTHPAPGTSITAFVKKAPRPAHWTVLILSILSLTPAITLMLGLTPWTLAIATPLTLPPLAILILDSRRQQKAWRNVIHWQQVINDWVNPPESGMNKTWAGAYVTQTSKLGDPQNPLWVIRIRIPQGVDGALKAGESVIRPQATPAGWNTLILLQARKPVKGGGIFDPNAVRLCLGHDAASIPKATDPNTTDKLATLLTDIAYARSAAAWHKRPPLTHAHDVSARPGTHAWLITLDMPPEGGSSPDLISLNWLADPQSGPAVTLGMPVEADLYDAFHLAADPDTPLDDKGNKWRPKGKLTNARPFQAYVDMSRRYRRTQTTWASLCGKLTPPTPAYDAEKTSENDGWTSIMTPLTFQPPYTVADYARLNLQPLDPQATLIAIAPGATPQDAWLIRCKGAAPTTLPQLTGSDARSRLLCEAILCRALLDTLPRSRGTASIQSCTQEGRDGASLWRALVTTGDGATVADLRKQTPAIKAATGAPYVLWDWKDASTAVLWLLDGLRLGTEDMRYFRRARRQKEVIPLALSDAWGLAGITDPMGRTPEVTGIGVFPRNHELLKVRFRIPGGMSMDRVDANTDKFLTAAGYAYGRILPRGDEHGADLWDMALCKHSPFPTMVRADFTLDAGDGLTLPFGVDDMGEPVAWNLRDTYHIAVMGKSGTGKSSAAQILVADALLRGWRTIIIDPSKGAIDFTEWAKPLSLAFVGNGQLDETEAVVRWVESEMYRRVRLLSDRGASNIMELGPKERPPRLLVVFDELNGYLGTISKTAPNPNHDIIIANANAEVMARNNSINRTMTALGKIALQGRTAGISLLLGGQRLTVGDFEDFNGGKAFFRTLGRLLLGNDSTMGIISPGNVREANRLQQGMKGAGGQVPKGRGLWETMDGSLTAVQTFYGGGQDALGEAVAHLTPPEPIDWTPFMPQSTERLGEITRDETVSDAPKEEPEDIRREEESAEEIDVEW